MLTIFYYSLIPATVALLGGLLGVVWKPSNNLMSAAQHFAAGIVIAAVCVDLMPKLLSMHSVWAIAIGFVLGVALMLAIEMIFNDDKESNQGSMGLLAAVLIDVFIDGLLVGVAFAVSAESALLIAIALAFEVVFLSITTISVLKKNRWKILKLLISAMLITIGILVGAGLGGLLLHWLTGSLLAGVIGFGVAALLYLAIEELLKEAHEIKDSPWMTAMFFVGFLIILLIDKLLLE